ncbi:MAG: 3D domain-containing protein [Kiritimatiellales bacterium]|nr:3D domain-containing protein [Kiritimatiellales bacterium]
MKNLIFIVLVVLLSGCATRRYAIPRNAQARIYTMETTGYCKCKKCCGWKRNWLFQPVYASGPNKGKRKKVGITAAGTKAKPGTLAADIRYFPFGTVMYIPQYGYGRVEDIGGGIKGMHIDLYFRTHEEALQWGRRNTKVKVWKAGR